MSAAIDVDLMDGLALLRPRDRDLGPQEAEALEGAVRSLAPGRLRLVVVNFALVEYMSSVFLSVLVEIYKELAARGVRFALAELNRKNLEIIRTTKLDSVFTVFASVHDACASLRGDTC